MSGEQLGRLFAITLRAGSTAAVQAFVARGVNVDARDTSGLTPLMIAANRGHIGCARVLIDAGCDLFACDGGGRDASLFAREAGFSELADLIMQARAPASQDAAATPPTVELDGAAEAASRVEEGTVPVHTAATGGDIDQEEVGNPAVDCFSSVASTPVSYGEASCARPLVEAAGVGAVRLPSPIQETAKAEVPVGYAESSDACIHGVAPPSAPDEAFPRSSGSPLAGDVHRDVGLRTSSGVADSVLMSRSLNGSVAGSQATQAQLVPAIDDWLEDMEAEAPEQSQVTLIEAAGIQHEISSFGGVSLGDNWSDIQLLLPASQTVSATEPLAPELMDEARRVIARALLTGSLSNATMLELVPEADTEDFRRIIGQVVGDAGVRWDGSDDPWTDLAGGCDDVDEELVSETSRWVDEFRDALNEARHPPRGNRLIERQARLTREQEDNLFLVGGQALAEASVEMARSVDALDFILATDAAIREGTVAFGVVSRLEVEAAEEEDEEDDAEVDIGGDPTDATGRLVYPAAYETALGTVRRVRDSMRRGPPSHSDLRSCSSAIRQLALSHGFLADLCGAIAGFDGASRAATAVRSALVIARGAHAKLAEAHLPHVRDIARYYADRGLEEDDLIQEGTIGLMRAVDLFEPDRGFRFWTYAQLWVRQSMGRAVADKGRLIRIPVHVLERCRRVLAKSAELEVETGIEPTADELAIALEMPLFEVVRLLEWGRCTVVSEWDHRDELERLAVLVGDGRDLDAIVNAAQLRAALRASLRQLDARAERVLRMRFGIDLPTDYTLEDIGEQFSVTRERIRQIEAKALGKLGGPQRSRALRRFLRH